MARASSAAHSFFMFFIVNPPNLWTEIPSVSLH